MHIFDEDWRDEPGHSGGDQNATPHGESIEDLIGPHVVQDQQTFGVLFFNHLKIGGDRVSN